MTLESSLGSKDAGGNSMMPDRGFTATTASSWSGILIECRSFWGDGPYNDSVIEATPLKDMQWAMLFAYMHRRFGPPFLGADDYKDLTASWLLTSPDPAVFVQVRPALSENAGVSFTPRISGVSEHDCRRDNVEITTDRVEQIKAAYRAVLLDLLRPVGVRDQAFNVLGEIGDSDLDIALSEYDEETDTDVYQVKRHASACYPMPQGFFGGKEWAELCSIAEALGHGDFEQGRREMISQLRDTVFAKLRADPWAIKRLVLMGDYGARDVLTKGLHLTAEDTERFGLEMAALETDQAGPMLDEMGSDAIERAKSWLNQLGLNERRLAEQVDGKRLGYTTLCAWNHLCSLVNDDFPDGVLPSDLWDPHVDLATVLKEGFARHGRDDLSAWVDATLAEERGNVALWRICNHIQAQNETATSSAE